ncbi:hypothetical protein EJ110_NYTH50699 [Nymphaea thermarum]|nr:hypothetical protein EJ110_NYTH50699 [Nymphaea thermarum]
MDLMKDFVAKENIDTLLWEFKLKLLEVLCRVLEAIGATKEGSTTVKEKCRRMTSACKSTGDTIQLIDEMVSQNQAVLEPFINLGDEYEVQVEPNTETSPKTTNMSGFSI